MINRGWILVFTIIFLGLSAGDLSADDTVWSQSYEPAKGTRFIPVELWTGAGWSGHRELAMTDAELKFGKNFDKTITGPVSWEHPETGQTYQVYERENKGKVQLFTVRQDGAGLGRVYDSRGPRLCVDAIKFPLGLWQEGETRRFTFKCWKRGQSFKRTDQITIEEIDFVHEGMPHALRYLWVVDAGNRKGMNNAYTFAPGLGNVALEYRH